MLEAFGAKARRFGKRVAKGVGIAALAGTVGHLACDALDDVQDRRIQAAVEHREPPESPEGLLNPEQLAQEYDKAAQLRTIYHQIVDTRRRLVHKGLILFAKIGKNKFQNWLDSKPEPNFTFQQLEELGIDLRSFVPLVDLGAFDLQKLRGLQLDVMKLRNLGIHQIVLMEDRDPQFFLNYQSYDPQAEVPLNRHGEDSQTHPKDRWTMEDLKTLIDDLHDAGIKVMIGFWANSGYGAKDHNPFVKRNWQSVGDRHGLQSIIPTSDDFNVFTKVEDADGQEMLFADYVVAQSGKLQRDFKVDGLVLGDGLLGTRSFMDNEAPYDASSLAPAWTDFYRRIYAGIKAKNGELWAYDCMANGRERAKKNGLRLEEIGPNVDRYVFQSYPVAWGEYMGLRGYGLPRDAREIGTFPPALHEKAMETIELGDRVEGWTGVPKDIELKHRVLGPDARKGTLGVWSTVPMQKLWLEGLKK